MKKKILSGVMLFSLPLLIIGFSNSLTRSHDDAKKDQGKKVEWLTFDEGIEMARKNKKLLVVDFYTDWCHWCKVMEKETYSNQDIVDYAKENIVLAKLNAETNDKFKFKEAYYSGRELSMMFGVTGFPTTAFLDSKGSLITTVSGYIPADKFKLILKFLAEEWYQKMKFEDFVKQEGKKDKS
ncbi:MAG: thioredoxin family protein [bacterium]